MAPMNSEKPIQIISSGTASGNATQPIDVTNETINPKRTSPAKILPYKRNPRLITFVNFYSNLIGKIKLTGFK